MGERYRRIGVHVEQVAVAGSAHHPPERAHALVLGARFKPHQLVGHGVNTPVAGVLRVGKLRTVPPAELVDTDHTAGRWPEVELVLGLPDGEYPVRQAEGRAAGLHSFTSANLT